MSRKRKSDQQSTETQSTPVTAATEPQPTENHDEKPSFTERLGDRNERVTIPDPFMIAGDFAAGVRLFESKLDRQMAIKFDEKPGQPVIDKLKDAEYRWNPDERVWAHPVWRESAMGTRIDAERLYQEIRQMIREKKGLGAAPEVPF